MIPERDSQPSLSYDLIAAQIVDFVLRTECDLALRYVAMLLAQAHDRGLRAGRAENTDRIVEAVIAEWRAALERQGHRKGRRSLHQPIGISTSGPTTAAERLTR